MSELYGYPTMLFVSALAAFAVMVVIFLATRPRPRPVRSLKVEPRRDFSVRDGLAPGETHPRWKDHPTERTKRVVRLTARDLERINIRRKLADRRPLTLGGFTNGLAAAPPNQSGSDLLMWLLIFESSQPGHYGHRCSVESGISVTPDAPYNGLGGSYGGAGSSGSWGAGTPDGSTGAAGDSAARRDTFEVPNGFMAVTDAEGRATGEVVKTPAHELTSAPDPAYFEPYKAAEPEHVIDTGPTSAPSAPPAATPDPTPSYSAPDPTPSYSAPDTSSSYSSPSFDSGSSASVSVDVG